MSPRSPLPPSDLEELSIILFSDWKELPTLEELEKRYPPRNLPESAKVTRVAPSPTGYAHIGLVYAGLISRKIAHQTGGVFMLRVEDTDSKREVKGAFELLVSALSDYYQSPDEGFVYDEAGKLIEKGQYGSYLQSVRRNIYRACAMHLVKNGLAYPCFCEEKELEQASEMQRLQKVRPGYYGHWARWRDVGLNDIKAALAAGKDYVIRLRAPGDPSRRVSWKDGVKGTISMPENDLDTVILKSDGQSLYHLAHAMDDHFMRINQVIRGDEWISSVPLHIQIFQAFGWSAPDYAHLSPIQKLDKVVDKDPETGAEITRDSRRKLSKRKDPEASVSYYYESGFPADAVVEYLFNIANSDFEDWRKKNEFAHWDTFELKLNRLSPSGALADTVKLSSISRDVIGRMTVETLYAQGLAWAKRYDQDLAVLMESQADYTRASLNIERGGKKASKRIITWKDLRPQLHWFFDELFSKITNFEFPEHISAQDRAAILRKYLEVMNFADDRDVWFGRCKEVAKALGYASEMKEFKANPSAFKGHIGDVTMVIRVALSSSKQSPDLYEVISVLGEPRVRARLSRFCEG